VISIATLDGGSAIIDSGYSDTDREVSVDIQSLSDTEFETIRDILKLNSVVLLFLPDGAFKASPESITSGVVKFLISGPAVVSTSA
jgi:hypothetical protein